jgi:CDP-diacylglycerol pyrophosphatase
MKPRLGLAALILLATPSLALADANALWRIVHEACVPHMQLSASPTPCAEVSTAGRYAVLKSNEGTMQYLLIPTDRVTGIESPLLQRADTPNYFARAWDARAYMERSLGRPIARENLALTINSRRGRSQNQLHIHISCVSRSVKAQLARQQARIGPNWAPLPTKLAGKPYWARRVEADTLDAVQPFRDLSGYHPKARGGMADTTLAAVGMRFADGRDGFVLLVDRARPLWLDFASAEADVQDHRCKVLKQP